MNTLLFNPDYMAKYYNCSGRTYDEWKALGQPNILLGFVYTILGVIFMTILLPFMIVFVKSDLMKYSCYKIMFFLGIVDCIQIPIGGFFAGYAAAVGMVYCMAPTVNYIMGCIGLACWCSGSLTCMILAFNRSIDLIKPDFGRKIFSGRKTIIWLLFPVIYFFLFSFFHSGPSFNSNFYAFFFDPFVGTPERNGFVDSEHYPHMMHSLHNVMVLVVLIAAYSSLIIHLSIKTPKSQNVVKMSRIQRQTILQCTVICTGTFITTVIYVYMQFLPTPVWVVIIAEITWQLSHGAAGISYALFNTTLRKELIKVFCSKSVIAPLTSITARRYGLSRSDYSRNLKY